MHKLQHISAKLVLLATAKDPKEMSASSINSELDRLDKLFLKINDEFIAAGRGSEKPSDYLKKDDELSLKMREVAQQRSVLRREIDRRYGPGAPNRLPVKQRKTI